jgi:hypothetical protein
VDSFLDTVEKASNTVKNWVDSLFESKKAKDFEDTFVKISEENTLGYWNRKMMNAEIAGTYKKVEGEAPRCNIYLTDKIREVFGEDMYNQIFPYGVQSANDTFNQFANNPNLQALEASADQSTIDRIQAMADSGILIIMSYLNTTIDPETNRPGSGHLALVAPSGVEMFSIPPVYNDQELPHDVYGYQLNSATQWPVLSQGGEVTGNVPMTYGTTGWNRGKRKELLENDIRFYAVRRAGKK